MKKTIIFLFLIVLLFVPMTTSQTAVKLGDGVSTSRNIDRPFVQLEQTRFQTMEGIYGGMSGHNDVGFPIVIGTANVTVQIQNFTEMLSNNVDVDETRQWLNVNTAGVYQIVWAFSFSSATGGNREYQITPYLNNITPMDECEAHRKLGAGGDVGSSAGTCLFNLSEEDNVSLHIKNIEGNQDATGFTASMNIERMLLGQNDSELLITEAQISDLNHLKLNEVAANVGNLSADRTQIAFLNQTNVFTENMTIDNNITISSNGTCGFIDFGNVASIRLGSAC